MAFYLDKNGFSLIEIIVVLAILSMMLSLGLLATSDSLKSTLFRSERLNIVNVLEGARSRSINNFYASKHGVCLETTNPLKPRYVTFRNSYTANNPANEYLDSNAGVKIESTGNTFSCGAGGIIFNQLSGNTASTTIIINEDARISAIGVNVQGRIDW